MAIEDDVAQLQTDMTAAQADLATAQEDLATLEAAVAAHVSNVDNALDAIIKGLPNGIARETS